MQDATRFKKPAADIMPPAVGRALVILLLATLVFVAWARLTDQPLLGSPPESAIAQSRMIVLDADISGEVKVYDTEGALIADLPSTEGGFISTVDRVIDRVRLKHGVAPETPIQLRRHENGRVTLFDPATGWDVDLVAFGHDNVGDFARLLTLQAEGN